MRRLWLFEVLGDKGKCYHAAGFCLSHLSVMEDTRTRCMKFHLCGRDSILENRKYYLRRQLKMIIFSNCVYSSRASTYKNQLSSNCYLLLGKHRLLLS